MLFRLKQGLLPFTAAVLFCACGTLQKTTKRKGGGAQSTPVVAKAADTSKKELSKLKPYKEVITDKAVTDSGLFIVHRVVDKYYFEIPDSLMDRDILVVNRITKAAAENRPIRGFLGYAGDQIGGTVFQFSKGPNNKLFIKEISYLERSMDSSANGMYRSVRNSTVQPIIASFDIKAIARDLSGVVVDLTDFIAGDNELLFFDGDLKIQFSLGSLQADKSYVEGIRSYPLNVEIKTVKTYGTGAKAFTYGLNSSIVLLPSQPMKPRYEDDRIGYFSTWYRDFDVNSQGVEVTSLINRWRLEPKEEDIERYKRGELVEPKKPIMFYIDPATPKKWVPYLIAGVNDWQQAFEKAGFKNAIYALEAPKDDSTWSLEDVRYSAIVYKPSYVANAYGPNVHDPRTGEILESKIGWFHNVMELLHDWYMIQAGPNDARARKMQFDDELMGKLIRFVSSHEVGHTLGLAHNFGSSTTIPVDSLRSKRYVEANGFCPSIMDYARFNYVAQPEDNISEKGIMPRIGVYDDWAIEWGYKWLPQLKSREEEEAYMNKWIVERVGKDKRLWYGSQLAIYDPRCQSEDVGDEPWKAGVYGIKNLKRVMNNLVAWTTEPSKNYKSLERVQKGVITQYRRYIFHTLNYMYQAVYWTPKKAGEAGRQIDFPSKDQQQAALRFLQEELFKTPNWLTNDQIFSLTGVGSFDLGTIQEAAISRLLSNTTLGTMSGFAEKYSSQEPYKVSDRLNDLKRCFWSELRNSKPINSSTRYLQSLHIKQLTNLLQKPAYDQTSDPYELWYYDRNSKSGVHTLVRAQLKDLLHEIGQALPGYKDAITREHLQEIRRLINKTLKPEGSSEEGGHDHSGHSHLNGVDDTLELLPLLKKGQEDVRGCWE